MNSENKRMFSELTNKANEVGKKINVRNVGKNPVILMEKHKNKKDSWRKKYDNNKNQVIPVSTQSVQHPTKRTSIHREQRKWRRGIIKEKHKKMSQILSGRVFRPQVPTYSVNGTLNVCYYFHGTPRAPPSPPNTSQFSLLSS